jgi:hypothetical protein
VIAVAGTLAAIQLILTPYLAYEGRGVKHALLPDPEMHFLLCVLVFVAALGASVRSSTQSRPEALWFCCFRSALWAGILTLFFFETVCCCLLRFDEVPPSGDLHWNAVIVFFDLVWGLSFYVLLIGSRCRRTLSSSCS